MHVHRKLAVTSALTFGLLLAGCGGANTVDEADNSVVEIEFWHGFTEADGKVLDQLVEEFNSSQEDVVITPVTRPWDTLLDTALPALSANEGPQLIALPPENIPVFADKGALVPLDDWYEDEQAVTSRLNPQAVATGNFEGERYGAPLSFTPLAMFYNAALFDEAGVEVPTTWDEWINAAERLTIDSTGDGTPDQYGFALQDNATVGNGVWMSLLKSGGGDVVTEDGTVVVNSPENIATVEYWVDAVSEHSISPTGLTGVDADGLFAAGRAAMTLGGPWLATVAEESDIEYGIAPLPEGPAGIHASALAVDVSITAQATDAERQGAYEFLTWFYSHENMIQWSLASGWPPLTNDVQPDEVAENSVVEALTEQAEYGVALLPGIIPQAEILKDLDTATQRALAGGDVAELLEEAQKNIESKLN